MKKVVILLMMMFVFLPGQSVKAQQAVENSEARGRILSETGKQIIFDVSNLDKEAINYKEYHWNFGDGGSAEGAGVLHSYFKPGYYQAELMMSGDEIKEEKRIIDVYVYDVLIAGVIDSSVDRKKLKEYEQAVFDKGMLLWVIDDARNTNDVDEIADVVIGNKDIVQRARGMVVWGAGNFGLDLLVKIAQRSDIDFSNMNVAIVALGRVTNLKKTAYSAYSYLDSNSMVLIGERSMEYLSYLGNIDDFVNKLKDETLDYELIGIKGKYRIESSSNWMILSRAISYMLFKGVPLSTIALILLIPLIALIIAVARQVVGIKAFGIYVPSLITLAFLEGGLRYGTVVFMVVLAVGTLTRIVLKKIKILYLPRMAIILTSVALGLLGMMFLASYFNFSGIKTISIVPLLTMVILAEKFVSAQIRYSFGEAIKLTFETYLLSTVCYFLVGWQTMRVFIISYPEIILLTLPILILLGRWTGLRLTEYWRFRRLVK